MIKFLLKVVILGAVFYGLTYFEVLPGLTVHPNEALLGLTALITDRLEIDGFLTAILGGLILAVAGWLADQLLDR